jgi:hypothetical protein
MGQVLAHETGHIFYALDEYPDSHSYYLHSGYYNTQNLNASDDHPNPSTRVDSLMAEYLKQNAAYAAHTSSPTSLEMLGWKDNDSDAIFNLLDVELSLTGSGSYNSAAGQYEFSGNSSVNTLNNLNPDGNANDITTNTIDKIQYRLDSGTWTDGNTYTPAYSRNVSQNVSAGVGSHTVEFRTVFAETGLTSNVWSDTFDAGDTPPTVTNVTSTKTNGSYGVGEMIAVTVAFDEVVTVDTREAHQRSRWRRGQRIARRRMAAARVRPRWHFTTRCRPETTAAISIT